jgi:hypothetical protein
MHLGRPRPWAGLGRGIRLKISRVPHHTPIVDLQQFRRYGPPRSQKKAVFSRTDATRMVRCYVHPSLRWNTSILRYYIIVRCSLGFINLYEYVRARRARAHARRSSTGGKLYTRAARAPHARAANGHIEISCKVPIHTAVTIVVARQSAQ